MVHVGETSRSYGSVLWSLGLLISFALLSLAFYSGVFTGFAGLSLDNDPLVAGELVTGQVIYQLDNGPLPLESEVTLFIGGYERTVPLEALYDPLLYRAERVAFAPLVEVTVAIREISSGGGGGSGELVVANPSQGSEAIGVGSFPINGLAIAPFVDYETYRVRKGSVLEFSIPSRRSISIHEVKVASTGKTLSHSEATLRQEGTTGILSTRYEEYVPGFALKEGLTEIPLSLDAFQFTLSKRTPSTTTLSVILEYNQDQFAKLEKDVGVTLASTITPGLGDPTSAPTPSEEISDGGSSGEPGEGSPADTLQEPPSCDLPVCTPYGGCTIPSFERSGRRQLPEESYVRSSQCVCEDGSVFIREESCGGSGPGVGITTGMLSGGISGDVTNFNSLGDNNIQITSGGGGGGERGHTWDTTYSYDDQDFVVSGSIAQALSENERIELPLGNELHSVGVIDIDFSKSVPRALMETASTPQRFYLDLGSTVTVDVNHDEIDDFGITFVSLTSRTKAVIRVAPLDAVSFSHILNEGEHAATLLKLPEELPVAYVILNEDLPALRVFFIQSADSLPAHCFDSIRSNDEVLVDCGGSCGACKGERPFIAPYLAWGVVVVLFMFLMFLSRRPL